MNTTLKHALIAFTCIVTTAFSLHAQSFHMVKDVNASTDGSPVNDYYYSIMSAFNYPFAVRKNVAYFSANDGIHGREVWRSDGTVAGTYVLKDVDGSPASSSPSPFVTSGKYVYFRGDDSIHGSELWRTDGTAEGTVMVKDLTPGTGFSYLSYLTNVNGTLFFSYDSSNLGAELMKSDGTNAGTVLVKDVTPGTDYSRVEYIINAGSKAFYSYTSPIDSLSGLYRSDGTAAGTFRLTRPYFYFNYTNAAAVGDKLFFVGSDNEPWISDGTIAGTHLIKTINSSGYGSSPSGFTAVGGIAYFIADDGTHGTELWRSNGTPGGTRLVKDITTGTGNSSLSSLTAVGSTLFFLVTNNLGNTDLWKSDGTEAGTVLVKTFGTEPLAPAQYLTNINDILYFQGYTAAKGYEMWLSDGTTAGTVIVKDIYSGLYSSSPSGFTPLNDKILFSATDGSTGTELWVSNGKAGNASLLKDINKAITSNGIYTYPGMISFKDKLYFIANTPKSGAELWSTDGTATNTKQVTDIQPGSLSGVRTYSSKLFTSSSRLYFQAANLQYGNELWSLKGDSSALVQDITPGRRDTYFEVPYNQRYKKSSCNIESTAFFLSSISSGGSGLWKTTGMGASLLKQDYDLSCLTPNKNDVYFSSAGGLWKTDGTVAGTVRLNNAYLPNISRIQSIISFQDKIYYESSDHAMWVTNGTDAGTTPFKNIDPQFDAPSNPANTTSIILNNNLFFVANDGHSGKEIWKTDGTANGTVLLKNINTNYDAFWDDYRTGFFTKVGSLFYFLAYDGIHGTELWKSDGTANGTVMVKDITPGSVSTQITSLTQVGNKLAFLVLDPATYKEALWQSDGTDQGTKRVKSASLDSATIYYEGYNNNALFGYKNNLYFAAYTPLYGYELWTGTLGNNLQGLTLTGNLVNNSDARLNWNVEDEDGLSYYNVQRSTDGVHFSSIGMITARNQGLAQADYNYTDRNIHSSGAVYYRLEAINNNGTSSLSNVVKLQLNAGINISILPSPVLSNFKVQVSKVDVMQQAQVQISSANGIVLLAEKKTLNSGSNTWNYNAGAWPSGVYTVKIMLADGSVQAAKMIKQ